MQPLLITVVCLTRIMKILASETNPVLNTDLQLGEDDTQIALYEPRDIHDLYHNGAKQTYGGFTAKSFFCFFSCPYVIIPLILLSILLLCSEVYSIYQFLNGGYNLFNTDRWAVETFLDLFSSKFFTTLPKFISMVGAKIFIDTCNSIFHVFLAASRIWENLARDR